MHSSRTLRTSLTRRPVSDDRLPHVPHPLVLKIVGLSEPGQVGLAGQRAGDFVREGPARCPARGVPGCRHRGDEFPVQAELAGDPGLQGIPQQLADTVGDDAPGVVGHRGRRAVRRLHRQGRQSAAGAMTLIRDEPLGKFSAQCRGVVPAAGRLDFQEGAQFGGGPADLVERHRRAGAARGAHQAGQVVPEQVTQPALGDGGQVDVAGAMREADTEVVGLDEPGVPGLGRREVDQPQVMEHRLGDPAVKAREVV